MIHPVEHNVSYIHLPAEKVEDVRKQNKVTPQISELEKIESNKQDPISMVDTANALFDNGQYNIQFEQRNNQVVIQLYDSTTKELVRQIPPEELMKLKERMDELKGQFIDIKA